MDFDNKKKKVSGNVNVVCGADLWQDLHELHQEFGINKSDILNNFIHHHYKTKDDFMKVLAPVIRTRLERQIADLKKLEGKVDSIQAVPEQPKKVYVINNNKQPKRESTWKHGRSIKSPVVLEKSMHKCEFTEQSLSMVEGQAGTWLYDTKTIGLAIRFNNYNKIYYTRARNQSISNISLKVIIGETDSMTLDEARKIHAQNLHIIYNEGIDPNEKLKNQKLKSQCKWIKLQRLRKIMQSLWTLLI